MDKCGVGKSGISTSGSQVKTFVRINMRKAAEKAAEDAIETWE